MKKLYVILAVTCIYISSCSNNTRERADQTNHDSSESRSTDSSMNMRTDTSSTQNNPAAPGATNAQF